MLSEFVFTVYVLVREGRWDDLREYFALIREILSTPTLTVRAGKPRDKET
jgi:hypothetical protein